MQQTYNFSSWQQDGADTPALVKLKKWWFKNPDPYIFDEENDGIDLDRQGHLYVECGDTGGVVYFPTTLLPYFFDAQGIYGHTYLFAMGATQRDFWKYKINLSAGCKEEFTERYLADHALWDRCRDLLNEKLTTNLSKGV